MDLGQKWGCSLHEGNWSETVEASDEWMNYKMVNCQNWQLTYIHFETCQMRVKRQHFIHHSSKLVSLIVSNFYNVQKMAAKSWHVIVLFGSPALNRACIRVNTNLKGAQITIQRDTSTVTSYILIKNKIKKNNQTPPFNTDSSKLYADIFPLEFTVAGPTRCEVIVYVCAVNAKLDGA